MPPVLMIPTLGRPHLRACIESIDMDVRLVVIANGGHDFDWLPEDAWLVHLPGNIGYSGAINLTIKTFLDEPYWLVANDDVVFGAGDLQRLAGATESGDWGWVGLQGDWRAFGLTADAVERVGWWDEGFWPIYCEDADYERRCDLAGVRWGFIDGSTSHAGSACLRVHRDDNDRSYPLNVDYYKRKWNTGIRQPGGSTTPRTPALPTLSHLRERAWRPDR